MTMSLSLRTIARRVVPLLGAAVFMTACGSDTEVPDIPSNPAVETYAASLGVNIAQMTKRSDNLYIQDLQVGTGADIVASRTIQVRYSGWLINANRFDSGTIDFAFGVGQVIPGWDQGLVGMKVGGKRKLVIGSALGYGRSGSGPIPPNSTLVFDVELLAVR
jgi:FKBP-type peptidyl-prolyl cis-trans isomerase